MVIGIRGIKDVGAVGVGAKVAPKGVVKVCEQRVIDSWASRAAAIRLNKSSIHPVGALRVLSCKVHVAKCEDTIA
jgi:hypothetical protein